MHQIFYEQVKLFLDVCSAQMDNGQSSNNFEIRLNIDAIVIYGLI